MNEIKPQPLSGDTTLLLKGFLHDLNNFFTCALSYLGQAQAPDINQDLQHEYIDMARIATVKATELASLLMKVCTGYAIPKEKILLQSILADTAKIALSSIKAQMEWSAPDHQCYINADASAIMSVLINLLFNADHAINGQGTIRIECISHEDNDDNRENILIKIIDHGCGFIESEYDDMVQRLFEPRAGEHGLGLKMASTIIEQHGGRLILESETGKGTIAIISLPVVEFLATVTNVGNKKTTVD